MSSTRPERHHGRARPEWRWTFWRAMYRARGRLALAQGSSHRWPKASQNRCRRGANARRMSPTCDEVPGYGRSRAAVCARAPRAPGRAAWVGAEAPADTAPSCRWHHRRPSLIPFAGPRFATARPEVVAALQAQGSASFRDLGGDTSAPLDPRRPHHRISRRSSAGAAAGKAGALVAEPDRGAPGVDGGRVASTDTAGPRPAGHVSNLARSALDAGRAPRADMDARGRSLAPIARRDPHGGFRRSASREIHMPRSTKLCLAGPLAVAGLCSPPDRGLGRCPLLHTVSLNSSQIREREREGISWAS